MFVDLFVFIADIFNITLHKACNQICVAIEDEIFDCLRYNFKCIKINFFYFQTFWLILWSLNSFPPPSTFQTESMVVVTWVFLQYSACIFTNCTIRMVLNNWWHHIYKTLSSRGMLHIIKLKWNWQVFCSWCLQYDAWYNM